MNFGVDVDDPGGGPEDHALVPEDLLQLLMDGVEPGELLGGAVVQVRHGHIPELPVDGELQEGPGGVFHLAEGVGTAVVLVVGGPAGVGPEQVVVLHALQFHGALGEQLLGPAQGVHQVQLDGGGKGEFPLLPVIGGGAVVQQQRRIDGNQVELARIHGHTAPGVHGEHAAVFDKIADGLNVALRDGRIGSGQGAVKVNGQ